MSKLKRKLEIFSADHPVKSAFLIFLFALIIVVFLSFTFYGTEFYENILVEAHGIIFDLFVIGVLVLWINSLGERRRNIRRYSEEIEDYLGWQEPEATYRIVGNIRRLNREGITGLYLDGAYLQKANLEGVDLRGSLIRHTDLRGANLIEADLRDANLWHSTLKRANLFKADLRNSNLCAAILQNTTLIGANLEGAKYSQYTVWPDDFDLEQAGVEFFEE